EWRVSASPTSPRGLHIRSTRADEDDSCEPTRTHNGDRQTMNGRTIARILLAVVLIGGAISLGVSAYNAGVTAGLAQTGQVVVTNGGYVAPGGAYVGYGWGFGWGHGFGFFGLLGGLLFLFLFLGLLRGAFGGAPTRLRARGE